MLTNNIQTRQYIICLAVTEVIDLRAEDKAGVKICIELITVAATLLNPATQWRHPKLLV
jgi:hypothetical protein